MHVYVTKRGVTRFCGSPAILHHPTGAGGALKDLDENVLPICPYHHTDGGHGEAIHSGTESWEVKFGTQEALLERRNEMMGI